MKAFVSVAFGQRNPVFHPCRICGVHVGYNRICEPAVAFLFFTRSVDYHPDGKKVVDPLQVNLLLFHLIPDGGNRFSSPLDVELQPCCFKFIFYGVDERFYICFSAPFCFIELMGNLSVDFAVCIFERKVFKFAFDFVEPESVGKLCIKEVCFKRHIAHPLLIGMMVNRAHENEIAHNHDYNHADVICQCEH